VLRYEHVAVTFGATRALDEVSIGCATGTTTMVPGASGCGKSTLLRLAVGLLTPTAGRVHGREVVPAEIQEARHTIGDVPQDGGLFPHLDVHANVTLPARHLGWASTRVDER
jgi:ABC-type proline/glycine betaine transport system ATPase subunit